MLQREMTGVKCLSTKLDRARTLWSKHVPLLAHERMSAQSGLKPDLIAASALQPHLDQSGVRKRLERAIVRNRRRAARVVRVRLLLDERFLVPHEDVAPRALRRLRMPVDDGDVHTIGGARFELRLQM